MDSSFIIDWTTLGELDRDELLNLLRTANEQLSRQAPVALQHVTLEAVKNIFVLCNREDEDVGKAASELVQTAFAKLGDSDKNQILRGIDITDSTGAYIRTSISLFSAVKTNYSRQMLMRLVPDETSGIAAMESLKSFPPPTISELQELYEKCAQSCVLVLRVLDLGAQFDTTQSWAAGKLREVIGELKSDPLALVNVMELISTLPNEIVKDSIDDLCSMLNDPIVQSDIFISYFLRLFTKYFSKSLEDLPQWYLDLLFKEDIPIELFLSSVKYIFEERPQLDLQFRNRTNLVEILNKNSKRHLIDQIAMEALGAILEGSTERDAFRYWFPNALSRHLIICSNDPDKKIRETSLSCIFSCARYPAALGHFKDVPDFTGLLQGPGCNDIRSEACFRFANQDKFGELFGDELREVWARLRADTQMPIPEVAIESMQM